ncbi:MAG TPA: hypothetical protein VIL36_08720 [Acidimicrobiales bacterium]
MDAAEPGPGVEAWQAWTPAEVAERLAGVGVPWCVVGGWSIDLFLGRTTRPHGDLEIAVARHDFAAIRRALGGVRCHAAKNGRTWPLPADTDPPEGVHQVWVLDPAADVWRVDVMLEPGDAETWRFRRDPGIVAPRAELVATTPDGIPYLRPQGALLFKATSRLPKDQHDFDLVVPRMDPPARAWLAAAVATHLGPHHPWIDALA